MNRAVYQPVFAGVFLLLIHTLLCAAPACAADVPGPSDSVRSDLSMRAEDDRAVTWTLNAEKVTSLGDSGIIEAEGKVILQRGGEYLKADYARYYMATKWVFLRGNVEANMGKDTMSAREAEFDLRSRIGWLKQGRIFMAGPHMYFSGERVDKHWGDVYSFKEARITSCDGDVPAWSLTASEAVVELDGYAQLWRPAFQVKGQSVAASPWMLIPAKKNRQTGFLPPETGMSTKRGFSYNQPFFWAIDESRDMTFNEYLMTKRGMMQGVEYRTRPSARETGWMRFDWLHDAQKVTNDRKDPVNSSDGLIRTNQERYWLRGMYEGHLADPRWKLRADLDLTSDQNMLHEFRSGYSGYMRSRNELYSLFRRDLQERNRLRQSGFLLFRDWDRVSVALSSLYLQNPALGHGNAKLSADTTVQQAPTVSAFINKGKIVEKLPFEIAASAETGYMYRHEGTRGMRYTMSPLLSLPVVGEYGALMLTGGVRQSLYGTDKKGKTDGDSLQDGASQSVPTFDASASTELMRVFTTGAPLAASGDSIGKSRWTAMRHAVQPALRYRNIPMVDQSDAPRYDDGDRVRPRNELVYSVTNVLTRKRERIIARKPEKEGDAPKPMVVRDYLDILRLTLEQAYDFREATRTDDRGRYERRPFGDIIGEAAVGLDEYVSFVTRSYWSPYLDEFTRHDAGVRLAEPKWGSIYTGIGYRRRLDEYLRKRAHEIQTLSMNGSLNLYGPWSARFSYSHDYARNENVDRVLELVYTHQCFQIVGIFAKDGYEEYYGLRVALRGLGG